MLKTKLTKDISTLTLEKFIACLTEGDYKQLIARKGLIPVKPEELKAKWLDIYQEFNETGQSAEGAAYLSLMRQRYSLKYRLELIETVIVSLTYGFNAELADSLRFLGIKVKIRKESLMEDLKRATTAAKSIVGQIVKLDKAIEPYVSGDGMSRSDFDEMLSVLSKFQGYRLDPKEITVLEYVNILKIFKKWQMPKK